MSLNIDASVFRRRVQLLQRNFKENKQFQAVTCLVSALGKGDDDVKDKTTSILHVSINPRKTRIWANLTLGMALRNQILEYGHYCHNG